MGKIYIAGGFVYGIWAGGFGAYPSRELRAKTLQEILKIAKKDLKSGALDSGMGFEYLRGAMLNIQEIETITINFKQYTRSVYITKIIGDLTEKEQGFLEECEY
jgi:hypothetical protein